MLNKQQTSVSESAFSSFSTSDPSEETAVCHFYEEFERQALFEGVSISDVVVKETGSGSSAYAVPSPPNLGVRCERAHPPHRFYS